MKTSVMDPWSNGTVITNCDENGCDSDSRFEDSFVNESLDSTRLSDSDEYLAKLYSRLKRAKGGTSKRDLVNSLSEAKEDCIARLVMNGGHLETEEEALLAANPLMRHIAPHLQALAASELVHLLRADILQKVTDEERNNEDPDAVGEIEAIEGEAQLSRPEYLDSNDSARIDDRTNVEQ